MKNCVIIMREELEVLMLLMGIQELEGIASIPGDYQPDENLMPIILKKKYLERTPEGTVIHKFVHFVLWTVAHAGARFLMENDGAECCNFYFYGETIIFVEKKNASPFYFFHWIPFVTTGIGALSDYFSMVPDGDPKGSYEVRAAAAPTDARSFRATVEGWTGGGETAFFQGHLGDGVPFLAALARLEDRFHLFREMDGRLVSKEITHTEFIQYIAGWLIPSHGSCIRELEERRGENHE